MKNKLLIIIVIFVLISSFFITYKVSNNILNNKYVIASISNSKLKVIGNIKNNDISLIKVEATGNNELVPYNLIWEGINKSNSDIEYKIYKTSKEIKEKELKEPIEEGIIKNNKKESITLVEDEFITSTNTGYKVYYYIKLESKEKIDIEGKIKIEESNSKPKINVIAAYIEQEDGSYNKVIDGIPTSGYTINKNKSACSNGATPMWDSTNKGVIVSNLTKNGTECYLYYDLLKGGGIILADNKVQGVLPESISTTACDDNTNDSSHASGSCTSTDSGVYETEDDFGKSYVFRGTVDNNWVHFANMYWRIIRINGNGTIRLIYAGTSKPTEGKWGNTGANAAIKISTGATRSAFNDYYNDNKYVGYMFGTTESGSVNSEEIPTTSYKEAHENNYESTIKEEIDKWYVGESGIQTQFRDKIDVETGFCNDRELSPATHGSYLGVKESTAGYANTQTAYAAYHRAHDTGTSFDLTQEPTLKCGNKTRDLFTGPNAQGIIDSEGNEIKGNNALTYPVGLITADEVIMAGFLLGNKNYGYWLYTGDYYWTMSPYSVDSRGYAAMFYVDTGGTLGTSIVNNPYGIRPVINLKANTKLTTEDNGYDPGTIENPYVVE